MKKILFIFLFCLFSFRVSAGVDELSVERVEDNVYKDFTSNMLIITEFCYEYAYNDDAILVDDDKLIFKDSGESCDVKRVIR